jgi:ArsR family transcriptional regulator, arsenate/arsenite/antimonite-responsive transcriptional repressor
MNDLVLFGKALSDPTRIRILAALRQSELCVCELSDALELTQSTLSSHLQIIRQAGLVTTRKDGKWIYYALDPQQTGLLDALFEYHKNALTTDRRMKRDAEGITHRLQLRVEGCCTLGFGQLETQPKGGETT